MKRISLEEVGAALFPFALTKGLFLIKQQPKETITGILIESRPFGDSFLVFPFIR